jgi:hypothetical protein
MSLPAFIITREFIASQRMLCDMYHQQKKRQRIVKKIEGKIGRGEVLTKHDLAQMTQYEISI